MIAGHSNQQIKTIICLKKKKTSKTESYYNQLRSPLNHDKNEGGKSLASWFIKQWFIRRWFIISAHGTARFFHHTQD